MLPNDRALLHLAAPHLTSQTALWEHQLSLYLWYPCRPIACPCTSPIPVNLPLLGGLQRSSLLRTPLKWQQSIAFRLDGMFLAGYESDSSATGYARWCSDNVFVENYGIIPDQYRMYLISCLFLLPDAQGVTVNLDYQQMMDSHFVRNTRIDMQRNSSNWQRISCHCVHCIPKKSIFHGHRAS